MASAVVYIALGSNLDDPHVQVAEGIDELAALPDTEVEAQSSLYESEPMGPQDQPDYVNAVVRLRTTLSPEALLDDLQAIEQRHGRQRTRHWGARTLDLDILLYGEQQIAGPRLQIPHPGIAARNFVLYPLAEIDSQLEIPGQGSVAELLSACSKGRLVRLDSAARSAG
jgi:2-amino-4-hydroxy-6-hydroxymethyldihydropteridine diphosphokinase